MSKFEEIKHKIHALPSIIELSKFWQSNGEKKGLKTDTQGTASQVGALEEAPSRPTDKGAL